MIPRCDACKHWTPCSSNSYLLPDDFTGVCSGMPSDKIEFIVKAGWNGGYVSAIETRCDFFCGLCEAKE